MGHDTLSKRVKGAISTAEMKKKINEWAEEDREEYGRQEGSWTSVSFSDFNFVDTEHVYSMEMAEELVDRYAYDYGGCILYVFNGRILKSAALKEKEAISYSEKRRSLEKKIQDILGITDIGSSSFKARTIFEQAKSFSCVGCKSKINLSNSGKS